MQRTHTRLLVATLIVGFSSAAHAAVGAPVDYAGATKLVQLPSPIAFSANGSLTIDSAKWTIEKDADGTELLTHKKGQEARVAAMKNSEGAIESFTSYKMSDKKLETASTLFFTKGQVSAITSCEEDASKYGSKDTIGRICVTATARLCGDLRAGAGLDTESMKEMEAYEMRALAAVLTLRGSEHQLDNVVKSGNRLGLKTGLQTTKGQLMALAKQVQKELKTDSAAGAAPLAENDERAKADNLIARSVLEKSLPRLKESCAAGHF